MGLSQGRSTSTICPITLNLLDPISQKTNLKPTQLVKYESDAFRYDICGTHFIENKISHASTNKKQVVKLSAGVCGDLNYIFFKLRNGSVLTFIAHSPFCGFVFHAFSLQKKKSDGHGALVVEDSVVHHFQNFPLRSGLYGDLPPASHEASTQDNEHQAGSAILSGLPLPFPNPAPEVDVFTPASQPAVMLNPSPAPRPYTADAINEPRKKKYAKEAWPGKKPTPSLLI